MATATRVPQDAKSAPIYVNQTRQDYILTETDGKESRRIKSGGPYPHVVAVHIAIPQPDRVRLELSLEEALTLSIIAYSTGGWPQGRRGDMDSIRTALQSANVSFDGGVHAHPDVLSPLRFGAERTTAPGSAVSPASGTPPSKAQDMNLGGECLGGASTRDYR